MKTFQEFLEAYEKKEKGCDRCGAKTDGRKDGQTGRAICNKCWERECQ